MNGESERESYLLMQEIAVFRRAN